MNASPYKELSESDERRRLKLLKTEAAMRALQPEGWQKTKYRKDNSKRRLKERKFVL